MLRADGHLTGAEACLVSAQRRGFEPDSQIVSELGADAAARLAAAVDDEADGYDSADSNGSTSSYPVPAMR